MLGITSYKVSVPAAMFLLFGYSGLNTKFNMNSVLVHSLVFCIAYAVVARMMGMVLTHTDLFVTTALFIGLTPGVLLTIPPGSRGTVDSLVVHTVVYAVLFALLRKNFPQYY
jgi:hypothetical protein